MVFLLSLIIFIVGIVVLVLLYNYISEKFGGIFGKVFIAAVFILIIIVGISDGTKSNYARQQQFDDYRRLTGETDKSNYEIEKEIAEQVEFENELKERIRKNSR